MQDFYNAPNFEEVEAYPVARPSLKFYVKLRYSLSYNFDFYEYEKRDPYLYFLLLLFHLIQTLNNSYTDICFIIVTVYPLIKDRIVLN